MTPDPVTSTSLPEKTRPTETRPDLARTEVEELSEFFRLIDALPTECRSDFYRALDRLMDGFERRQRILAYIQDSLTQMNLDLKYLVFDLEATRRERDDYRRQVDLLTHGE